MIKISKLADYAVVLLSYLVREKNALMSASILAERTGIPLPTVSKILKILANVGVIRSIRGAKGGYQLTRDIDSISVAEIVEVMDGPIVLVDCQDREKNAEICTYGSRCSLQEGWSPINDAMKSALETVSLGDLVGQANKKAKTG